MGYINISGTFKLSELYKALPCRQILLAPLEARSASYRGYKPAKRPI
jgi:hypothetical protein